MDQYSAFHFPENCIIWVCLYVYTYANITFIWTCVVESVIIVACSLCMFLFMCLCYLLVNCLLYVWERWLFSLGELLYCCCSEVCGTLVAVYVLLIISKINWPLWPWVPECWVCVHISCEYWIWYVGDVLYAVCYVCVSSAAPYCRCIMFLVCSSLAMWSMGCHNHSQKYPLGWLRLYNVCLSVSSGIHCSL